MTDKLAVYDNVMGVFADLDDGGLTEDEALKKIRGIVGAKSPIKQLVFSVLIPATVTFDFERHEVTEFEVNYDYAYQNENSPPETRIGGETIDAELYKDEIESARIKTFGDIGAWPDPERM